ncbi:UNVERIFIED_CONTAM: protein NRT1/ PTR FAMILY 3.1 [Sesamum radiatum]|uniref:Protein NRT1/ PTR FAMILY 3.1 n=1 Tax=Sesamum radiatum TaxID=300843 RepID=A0AAW2NTA8_SESRA
MSLSSYIGWKRGIFVAREPVTSSCASVAGMVTITISAALPQLRPPPCPTQQNCQEASNLQLWVLYLALLLTSLGTGGIRPCVVTFAADQFDMSKSKTESRSWNFFNWYYFCMGIASLLALTVVVYIQDNVSWGWGLGIPTIAMGLSLVAFIFGASLYKKIKPMGSPFVRVAQVIVAAVKKRNIVGAADPRALYENRELDADISTNGRLVHSDQFNHITSGLKLPSEQLHHSASKNHEPTPIVIVSNPTSHHVHIQYSNHPGLPLYERLFVPLARRFTRHPAGITCLQRMGIGFGINVFATIASALIETKRKAAAADHSLLDKPTAVIPISVFWLVPQYFLHGLAEIFMSVGHLEFLYDQSPESMRSTAAALYWIAIAIGNYVGTLMVSLVHKYTGEEGNWLPDRNLNRGKLENYYWMVTGLQVVNVVYYVTCAWFYKCKPIQEITDADEDVEFGGDGKGDKEVELARK